MTTSRDVLETLGTDKQPSDVWWLWAMPPGRKVNWNKKFSKRVANRPGRSEYSVQNADCRRWREAAKLIGVDILTMPGVAGTPDEWNLTRLRLRHQKHWLAVGQRITGTARPLPAIKAQTVRRTGTLSSVY